MYYSLAIPPQNGQGIALLLFNACCSTNKGLLHFSQLISTYSSSNPFKSSNVTSSNSSSCISVKSLSGQL